jgi:hypothetical protein
LLGGNKNDTNEKENQKITTYCSARLRFHLVTITQPCHIRCGSAENWSAPPQFCWPCCTSTYGIQQRPTVLHISTCQQNNHLDQVSSVKRGKHGASPLNSRVRSFFATSFLQQICHTLLLDVLPMSCTALAATTGLRYQIRGLDDHKTM